MVTAVDVAGTYALEPCYLYRFFVIGWSDQMPFKGTGGREDSFKLHAGDHVGMIDVIIGIEMAGIKWAESRGKDNGTDLDRAFLGNHRVINRFGKTDLDALITFRTDSTF
jgi:hypothetical protein